MHTINCSQILVKLKVPFLGTFCLFQAAFKFHPCYFIILFPVAAIKGRLVDNGALTRSTGQGIVGDGALHRAGFHVLDFDPFGSGEPYTIQALIAGEYNAAVLIIPSIELILP